MSKAGIQESVVASHNRRHAACAELAPLLAAAIRAPSGDNTQPWRFVVDSTAETVTFEVDETRDRSPMNSGQRMARIAVGAALENLLRTAHANGWAAALELSSPPGLVRVRLERKGGGRFTLERAVTERVTNRRMYDGRRVPPGVQARLAAETPLLDGVTTHWLCEPDRRAALAVLVGYADALMFGEPAMRRAFLSKVRFDAAPEAAVDDGLPLASLEIPRTERLALRMLAGMPSWVVRCMGMRRIMAAKARRLVESASGMCLIVAPDAKATTDVAVGRSVQRGWLALTTEGLAAQPMMSWLVLENILQTGDPCGTGRLDRAQLGALAAAFRSCLPEIGGRRPAFLLRFGFASAPSGRTGRRPLSAAVQFAPVM